jgi:SAM-dependent methyltransferase
LSYEDAFYSFRKPSNQATDLFLRYGNFSNKKIIDLGCGTSRYLSAVSSHNSSLIVGLDKSEYMIKKNRANFEYIIGNIESLPLKENSFDVVLLNLVIHQIKDYNLVLEKIYRVLSNEGILFILTVSPEQLNNRIILAHFPGLLQIELDRFQPVNEIIKELNNADFKKIEIISIKENYICTIEELVGYAKNKACSSLEIYEMRYGETGFLKSLNAYESAIKNTYLNPINENHEHTLFVCTK